MLTPLKLSERKAINYRTFLNSNLSSPARNICQPEKYQATVLFENISDRNSTRLQTH
jgi:hypothetical protein